jgi:hypothetical protein
MVCATPITLMGSILVVKKPITDPITAMGFADHLGHYSILEAQG